MSDEGYHSDGLTPTESCFKPWIGAPGTLPSHGSPDPAQSNIEYFGLQSVDHSLYHHHPACLKRQSPSSEVEELQMKQRRLQKENHDLRKRLGQAESKAKLAFTILQRDQVVKETLDTQIQDLRASLNAANERYLDATEDNYALRGEISKLRRSHFLFPSPPRTSPSKNGPRMPSPATAQKPQRTRSAPLDRQLEMRQLPEGFLSDSSAEEESDDGGDQPLDADSQEASHQPAAPRSRSAPPRPPRPAQDPLGCCELEGDHTAFPNERRNALSTDPESYLARTLQHLAIQVSHSSHARQCAALARIN